MKNVLFVDCLIRKDDSRTKIVADELINNLDPEYKITHLNLMEEDLKPLVGKFFDDRQVLLEQNNREHPRFRYAHQIADADLVIIAAPFWDLSFPALLKIYIENCSVDGITFMSDETGLHGLCKADNLVYVTTRGGIYKDSNWAQDVTYLKCIQEFFGFKDFKYIAADGMDINEDMKNHSLEQAKQQARQLAKQL